MKPTSSARATGPVGAYLDIPGIVALAKERASISSIPVYGFPLRKCRVCPGLFRSGITFVGPDENLAPHDGRQGPLPAPSRKKSRADSPGTEEAVEKRDEALNGPGKSVSH